MRPGRAVRGGGARRRRDKESDYLTTHESTRAERVVPVITTEMKLVGLIDVESERVGAFGKQNVAVVHACAAAIRPLWAS